MNNEESAGRAEVSVAVGLARFVGTAAALALPGRGRTESRFLGLAAVAEDDLALGRLAEGHADAIAILDEAGQVAPEAATYGVWAARSSKGDLAADVTEKGWVLHGTKGFCSGVGLLDRALVTADTADGPRLFDVDLRQPGIEPIEGSWPAVGMAGSVSAATTFTGVEVATSGAVGPVGWYTSRIGFWWGAAGVAACWWGGARGLLGTVGEHLVGGRVGDHEAAAFGAASAECQSMDAVLRWAARQIDGNRTDIDLGRRVALATRESIHRGAMSILVAAAAAGGARPICLDARQSRRSADLYAYLAQHHVGRDAATLGRQLLEERAQDRNDTLPMAGPAADALPS